MNNQFRNTGVSYEKIKRVLAGVVALVLWGLSIKFSVGGFGAGIDDKEIWIGWLLGFSITVVQLVWNGLKDRTNLTLFVLGLSAYLYGIFTNVIGIVFWRGDSFQTIWENPLTAIFPIVLGLFLEIAPEPLFVWAFTTRLDEGDFLGNLFGQPTNLPNQHSRVHNTVPTNNIPGLNNLPQNYRPIVNGRNKAGKEHNHQKNPFRREE